MPLELDMIVQVLLRERLRITAVAVAVVRDVHTADDIFQQIVLAAIQNRPTFDNSRHVLAWAIRTARHRAIDLIRSRHPQSLSEEALDQLEAAWANPHQNRISDTAEALQRCMKKLTTAVRSLLRLRYDKGLSVAEIAKQQGRTVDAVYQNLSRVHRSLRECVQGELAQSSVTTVERCS